MRDRQKNYRSVRLFGTDAWLYESKQGALAVVFHIHVKFNRDYNFIEKRHICRSPTKFCLIILIFWKMHALVVD